MTQEAILCNMKRKQFIDHLVTKHMDYLVTTSDGSVDISLLPDNLVTTTSVKTFPCSFYIVTTWWWKLYLILVRKLVVIIMPQQVTTLPFTVERSWVNWIGRLLVNTGTVEWSGLWDCKSVPVQLSDQDWEFISKDRYNWVIRTGNSIASTG